MKSQVAAAPQAFHFFRNYNRVVGAAYFAIVLGLCLVFAWQLRQKVNDEIAVVEAHVERHAQFFEFVLRSSTDKLEALRMEASSDVLAAKSTSTPAIASLRPSGLFALLRERADQTGFNLDGLPDRDAGANLVGVGRLAAREPGFYEDVDIGLDLFSSFRALAFNLPGAAQAQYLSPRNFAVTAPWVASTDRPFDAAVYSTPAWQLGAPDANPNRVKYWAPSYLGSKDQGLLVPAGAPVYQANRFAGVVSIDTSLDYLNRINAEFAYPLGTAFLVDAHSQVLAHPKLYANSLTVDQTPSLRQALPEGLQIDLSSLAALPSGKSTEIDGYLVVRRGFVSAPWQLVYTVPKGSLWRQLLIERGGLIAAVLVGLTLMMLVTYLVTSREFVGPAAKLVQHLAAESSFMPAAIPAVPTAWRPWFETVSKAFRESMQLAGLRQELDIAAKMQISILPRHWPDHPDFTVWGTMRSAKEVGGDFYDHFPVANQRLGLVVADVSGKGVPAALFGMVSKTLLRAIAMRSNGKLGQTVFEVNEGLCEDNESCMFVTGFYGEFDPLTGRLDYVNAGHPLPVLVRANGQASLVAGTGGLALGVMEGVAYSQGSLVLQAGDMVLMYSDGVTEGMNAAQDEYGTQRMLTLLHTPGRPLASVRETVEMLVRDVDRFAGGAEQSDDITCIALQYHPSPPTDLQRSADQPNKDSQPGAQA
jgi:phosphoserine phosphatase RsbU/P